MATTATGLQSFLKRVGNSGGISASNLYRFDIRPSEKLNKYFTDNIGFDSSNQDLVLFCNEIQLPGVTYSATDVKSVHKGITQKIASAKVYNELDVSFFMDADSTPLLFFRAWQDFTMGTKSTSGDYVGDFPTGRTQAFAMNYYNDYACELDIVKLEKYNEKLAKENKKGEPKYRESWKARLYKAYPYTVSSIPYSAGPAQLVKVSVGFYYEYSQLGQLQPPFQNRVTSN